MGGLAALEGLRLRFDQKPEEGTLKDEGTQHPASTRIPRPEVTRDSVSCWVWVLPASQSLYNARAGIITWLTS